ncbi:hypothetical protein MAPG_04778 [Magnaporthiopsis poae ATCC 64411]|uniref:Amidase domain-containing protein n=1 Tax=Magnaporthiopsis poae (strain ATCC 64411 / 73-15) TaxID=644358 RepID=A0A0C4DXM4_MAGP6|nr:hypothetical protein MAPG_04778 [Magnaporthiopsis poae ATCC 64411]
MTEEEAVTAAPWQDTVRRKLDQQKHIIENFLAGVETDAKLSIGPSTDVAELLEGFERGDLSCVGTTKAFIQRACKTHETTNCLTELVFEDALRQAAALDDHVAKNETLAGPLHGIPVTVKDQFNIAGVDTTLGYVGRSFKPAVDDAVLVWMLRSLGALIIAKSNLPQSIMWCETDNPLWGLTTHPLHKGYTPGGSTGGEAALLSQGASLLGWGTDIGGSIRIPAHMMGLYGFKPTSSRLPYRGVPVSTEGQEHVPSSVGPLARSLRTIRLAMESLIRAKPWEADARCTPIPWREDVLKQIQDRPLVVGVLYDDEFVRPHPPISRVLKSAIKALQDAGHEVFEWDAQLHTDCIELMDEYYTVDGGEDIRNDVSAGGEPLIPHVQRLVDRGDAISVYKYWQLNRRKWDLQQAYLEKWSSLQSPESGKIADVLVMPPMPHSAVPHRGCKWVGYTKVWNLLDYPAMVIPGGNVVQEDLEAEWDFEERNETDGWVKKLWTDNRDDMAAMSLPVGVQLVGRRFEEEKLLAAATVLDWLLRK